MSTYPSEISVTISKAAGPWTEVPMRMQLHLGTLSINKALNVKSPLSSIARLFVTSESFYFI